MMHKLLFLSCLFFPLAHLRLPVLYLCFKVFGFGFSISGHRFQLLQIHFVHFSGIFCLTCSYFKLLGLCQSLSCLLLETTCIALSLTHFLLLALGLCLPCYGFGFPCLGFSLVFFGICVLDKYLGLLFPDGH